MASKPNFKPLGIGSLHYIGPEHGGSLRGRACNTCVHVRHFDGQLSPLPAGAHPALCIHPGIVKTRELGKFTAEDTKYGGEKKMGVIDLAGCCDAWRDTE